MGLQHFGCNYIFIMTKEELAELFVSEKVISLNDSIGVLLKEAYLRGYTDAKTAVTNNPEENNRLSEIEIVYNNLSLPSGLLWSDYLGDRSCGYGRHSHQFFRFNEVKHLTLPTNEQVLELFKYTQKKGGETGDLYKRWNYIEFLSTDGVKYSLVQDQSYREGGILAEFWTRDECEDDITMAYRAIIRKDKENNNILVSFEKTFKGEDHSVVVMKQ